MTYEVLLHTPTQTAVIAKMEGWKWSAKELQAPFEKVSVSVNQAETDYSVSLMASWGLVSLQASWIDPDLITGGGE